MKMINHVVYQGKQISPLLFKSGIGYFLLAVIILIIFPFDSRELLGVSIWLKPLKFALSIGIYFISWAFILPYLEDTNAKRRFTRFTIFAMGFEMLAITSQAARAELSHFNQSGLYNIIVYALMGIVITTQTLFSLYIGILFFKKDVPGLSTGFLWAIRCGIIISALFALQGGLIGQRMAHTVGAPDGGAGIPVLNWSRNYGDLRIAHFFGLHSLQLIPLFVWIGKIKTVMPVILFALIYFAVVAFMFYHALLGKGY